MPFRCARRGVASRWAFVLCGASLGLRVWAGNPYHSIYDRNAFHLRSLIAARAAPPHEPLPLVKLTGITTILPGKRALLLVDFPVRPREKPREESYILAEGQRAGPIEVVAIDEKTAHVTVDESGTVTNLTFDKLTPTARPAPARAVYRWGNQPYRAVYH